jgi:hypothetical protein
VPTIVHTFADIEFNMRLNQVRATDGLNQKQAIEAPAGVYRGFTLAPNGAFNQTVQLDPDPDTGDSYAIGLTDTGFAVAVRVVGSFNIDLAALAGTTVFLVLVPDYTIVTPTTFEVQSFTEAEFSALSAADQRRLVVVGQVDVPAGAVPVVTADVRALERRAAYQNEGTDRALWTPLLQNGDFQSAESSAVYERAAFYWRLIPPPGGTGVGNWEIHESAPDADVGLKSLRWVVTSTGSFNGSSALYPLQVPVRNISGQRARVRVRVRVDQAAAAGDLQFRLVMAGADGTADVDVRIIDPMTASVGAYRTLEDVFDVSGFSQTRLLHLEVFFNNITFNSLGDAFHVDSVQVWWEGRPTDARFLGLASSYPSVEELRFGGGEDFSGYPEASYLRDPGSGTLKHARVDGDDVSASQPTFDTARLSLTRLVSSDAQAELTRFLTASRRAGAVVDQWTLLWENDADGAAVWHTRLYGFFPAGSTTGLSLAVTTNARYDHAGAQWVKDVGGNESSRVILGDFHNLDGSFKSVGPSVDYHTGASPFVETAWLREIDHVGGLFGVALTDFLDDVTINGDFRALEVNPDQTTELGRDLVGSAGNHETPRILTDTAPADAVDPRYTLLWEMDTGTAKVRLYTRTAVSPTADPGFVITQNARWREATADWVADLALGGFAVFCGGAPPHLAADFAVAVNPAAAASWLDTAWALLYGVRNVFFAGTAQVTNDLTVDDQLNVSGDTFLDGDLTSNNAQVEFAKPLDMGPLPLSAGRKIFLQEDATLSEQLFEEFIDFTALAADGATGTVLYNFFFSDLATDNASVDLVLELSGTAKGSATRTLHYSIVIRGFFAAKGSDGGPNGGAFESTVAITEQGRELGGAPASFTETVFTTLATYTASIGSDWIVRLVALSNAGVRVDTHWVGVARYTVSKDS